MNTTYSIAADDRLEMLRHSELDLMIAIEDDARTIAEAEGRIGANMRDLRTVRAERRLLERSTRTEAAA
jgi:hypothetical protein